jgi:hypothetical protein
VNTGSVDPSSITSSTTVTKKRKRKEPNFVCRENVCDCGKSFASLASLKRHVDNKVCGEGVGHISMVLVWCML